MTRSQRIVLIVYCLLVVYCCVWVPWHLFDSQQEVRFGYGWIWASPQEGLGGPDVTVIILRLLAATALSGAVFLLAEKWKALLSVAVLACAGVLLYGYWSDRVAERKVAERRREKIHDCAVAKVATGAWGCGPAEGQFQVCEGLPKNSTAQEEDAAIAAAEKECTAEIEPKKKSAHEQIEEYKRQHGIKE